MMAHATGLTLEVMSEEYAICRLDAGADVPAWAQSDVTSFSSVTRTPDELSIMCPAGWLPLDLAGERNWRGLRVVGTLDFEVTAIAAALTSPLAAADIPLLLIATYETDYVFVRADRLHAGCAVLAAAGWRIEGTEHS